MPRRNASIAAERLFKETIAGRRNNNNSKTAVDGKKQNKAAKSKAAAQIESSAESSDSEKNEVEINSLASRNQKSHFRCNENGVTLSRQTTLQCLYVYRVIIPSFLDVSNH